MTLKKRNISRKIFAGIFLLSLMLLSACDTTETKETNDLLNVKFTNDATSITTITSIYIQPMGAAGESTTPQGDWSNDILDKNVSIAPGETVYFKANIPNGEWVRCRLDIIDESGKEILMDDQPDYPGSNFSMTHWGSDDRTVTVDIQKSYDGNIFVIRGWSDWAGIED